MSRIPEFIDPTELHSINIAEDLAVAREWEHDRVTEDQIALAIEGQWRTYSLTLAWSSQDETLRLICTFECEWPTQIQELYSLLNLVNDKVWTGAFTYWSDQKLMVWRYGLLLSGDQIVMPEQVDDMIASAVMACERFYPAFQLAGWGGHTAADAIRVVVSDGHGRA